MAGPVHTQIGSIWIDVTIRQSYQLDADVTEHPVEKGADISDHIRPRPLVVSIDGLVTNHPIEVPDSHMDGARVDNSPILIEGELSVGGVGLIPGVDQGVALLGALKVDVRTRQQFSAQMLHFTAPFDRVRAVDQALQAALQAAALLTIVTARATYENVALTSYSAEIDGPGQKLAFSAQGKVLRVVSSEVVDLPRPVVSRALPKQSQGKQTTTEANAAEAAAAAPATGFAAKWLGIGG